MRKMIELNAIEISNLRFALAAVKDAQHVNTDAGWARRYPGAVDVLQKILLKMDPNPRLANLAAQSVRSKK